MSTLLDRIKSYIDMESTGALMVSGEWGCGKTCHINNVVIPALQEEGYNTVMVSLFGIESVNEIPLRIAEKFNPSEKESKCKLWNWVQKYKSKASVKSAQLVSSIKWFENYFDVKTLFNNHRSLLFYLIPKDSTVIFLDDIERVIDTIDIHTLLGAINDLVDQRGYKVVVIANNSYIQEKGAEKLVFKEKVIEKTLIYEPDVLAIFKELCNSDGHKPAFKEFMAQSKVLAVIDPSYPSYKEDKEMLADLHNIRIVKYAISHFNKIYEASEVFLKGEDKSVSDMFLMSLWACTVGLSIEYKKNRLTYSDREEFVNFTDIPLADLDLSGVKVEQKNPFDEEEDPKNDETEHRREQAQNCVKYLFEKVVKAHSLPVIVSPQLFDFITAGITIDSDGLNKVWENYKAEVQRNTMSPAYALLQRILRAQLEMGNDEMVVALRQLLKYVEEGAFADNMAYVNSATYLQHFGQLIGLEQADVENAIKKGIDKMYAGQQTLNVLDKLGLDATKDQIPYMSHWVVEYEKAKIEAMTEASLKSDIEEVCRQFSEDLPALVNRMTIHYGQTQTPDFVDYPILKHIPEADITRKVNSLQPKEVMALYHLIKSRFQVTVVQKVYEEELPFVRTLATALEQHKPEKKEYADYLIEDTLLPLMKEVVK